MSPAADGDDDILSVLSSSKCQTALASTEKNIVLQFHISAFQADKQKQTTANTKEKWT